MQWYQEVDHGCPTDDHAYQGQANGGERLQEMALSNLDTQEEKE